MCGLFIFSFTAGANCEEAASSIASSQRSRARLYIVNNRSTFIDTAACGTIPKRARETAREASVFIYRSIHAGKKEETFIECTDNAVFLLGL